MSTIIINKIVMHMIDFEHNKVYYSNQLVDLNESNLEYYKIKLEKTLYSNSIKELTVGNFHEMILRSKNMLQSEEEFIRQSKEITNRLYELGRLIEDMFNSNVAIVDCYKDGQRHIVIMKLNYKYVPVSLIKDDQVIITNQQVLPTKGSRVEEAIIVNTETDELYLIEKKFLIDGKLDFYLNDQWIKGEEKLTDQKKYNVLKKVVNKIDDQYKPNDIDSLSLMKQEITTHLLENEPIKPYEIVREVFSKDIQAIEESEDMLDVAGIGLDEEIKVVGRNIDKCKIVLDTNIEITMDIDDYVNSANIKKEKQEDGTINIILSNINDIIVK